MAKKTRAVVVGQKTGTNQENEQCTCVSGKEPRAGAVSSFHSAVLAVVGDPRYYTGCMNTGKILRVSSTSSAQTEQLAERLGSRLKGGEVIELISDLGGGKTTFVRGLARGFGSTDRVASPTFTISRVYQAGPRTIHHFDLYRLPEAGLIAEELAEVIGDQHCVTVIEWADVVQNVLPAERLTIEFRRTGDEGRTLYIHIPDALTYLTEGLQ